MLYTDRSRVERGYSCSRRRWYEYHELGSGIRWEGSPIAATVGSWTHKGVEHIVKHAFLNPDGQELPDRETVRMILDPVVNGFKDEVGRLGAAESRNETQLHYLINEQASLLEGLAWCAYRVFIPWLLENYTILGVEDSFVYITGCDCGLAGVGDWKDHRERGCHGLLIPIRQDLVLENKQSNRVEVMDWKTSSYGADYGDGQHMLQMLIACRGISWKYDQEVALHWIVNLKKGQIDRAKEAGELDRQNSPLCYGYFKMSDPPFENFEMSTKYTARKGFNRAGLWEAIPMLPPFQASGMRPMEWWVMEAMSEEQVRSLVEPVGPATRYSEEFEVGVLKDIYSEEVLWAQFTEAEDTTRTWNCRPYGQHYVCPYLGLCLGRELSTDSHWVRREPHHGLEVEFRDD